MASLHSIYWLVFRRRILAAVFSGSLIAHPWAMRYSCRKLFLFMRVTPAETVMAKTASASREELILGIERLTEQVRLLGNIIDDLTNELQWQNCKSPSGSPSPFMLSSISADPTADDWRVNQTVAETDTNGPSLPIRGRTQTLFD